jgi:PAS domain S-box-containing protein
MELLLTSIVNITVASVCFCLGALVLIRNRRKLTHQTFAIFSFNLGLWAIGVLGVINSHSVQSAEVWIHFSEIVSCFMPATLYHFIGYFPKGKFDASKRLLATLYGFAFLLSLNSLTPNYIQNIAIVPGKVPQADHHKSILLLLFVVILVLVSIHINLRRKFKDAQGFGRLQIKFVMTGSYTILVFGVLFILLEPVFKIQALQAYAPIIIMMMVIPFAYAMVRYHLLDTRAFVSKLSIYLGSTAFIVLTIISVTNIVQLLFGTTSNTTFIIATLLSALMVSLVFKTVNASVEQFIEVTLLRQRYDVNKLYRRLAQQAGESTHLDTLLPAIASDIQETVGVNIIRVLLVDQDDPGLLATEFTTVDNDNKILTREHIVLLDFLKTHPKPLILEKILHRRLDERMVRIARSLVELDAYFCMPLHTNKGLIGILALGQKNTHDVYSEEELLAFRALSGPLATAITNAWLFRELERLHSHQSNVFEQMREGVIAVNTKGTVTLVNRAACNMIGSVREEDSMGELHSEVNELLVRTLNMKVPINDFEATIVNNEGESISVIMSSSCLRTVDGKIDGVVALLYDLSPVKHLEQNVQRADRLSSIGTLAAGMAHEIKNPLVSIKTFTQLLLERYSDPDFRETFHDVVPHEVDRIDTIVSRLLDFARPRPVQFAPQNIRTIINEVLALVDNEIRRGNIEIQFNSPNEDLAVYGDEQQLHQVFLNLIMNAIDSMESSESDTLLIGIDRGFLSPQDGKRVSVFDTQACVLITLEDTGCGIPDKSIPELFTPFFTTKDKGCGLGLAVVHGIIVEHGGRIDVNSVINEGTTIRISLPKAESIILASEV